MFSASHVLCSGKAVCACTPRTPVCSIRCSLCAPSCALCTASLATLYAPRSLRCDLFHALFRSLLFLRRLRCMSVLHALYALYIRCMRYMRCISVACVYALFELYALYLRCMRQMAVLYELHAPPALHICLLLLSFPRCHIYAALLYIRLLPCNAL